MRLAQFIVGERQGGAERFFVKLSIALHEVGITQKIFIQSDKDRSDELRLSGLDVVELDFNGHIRDVISRYKLQKEINSFKPDLVMAWMSRAARRMPSGDFVKVARLGGFYPSRFYKRCDHLVSNTPAIKDFLVEDGWPECRVETISNFGELPDAPPVVRESLGISEDAFLFICLGRLHPSKGFDLAIEAIRNVKNAHLIIAGSGEEDEILKGLVIKYSLENRVSFLGWRNDQIALLKTADVCLVTSRHEPLSNVVLEAWSVGCPVISTDSEGPSWLIQNGIDGLMVKRDDVEALTAAMQQLMDNEMLRKSLSERALIKWANSYSKDVIVEKYITYFKKLINLQSSSH